MLTVVSSSSFTIKTPVVDKYCNFFAVHLFLHFTFLYIFSPADNGLNPTWPRKPFQFTVGNSAFAFLRFVVYEIDMFNDQNFLAQATFPIHGLKTGTHNNIVLKYVFSEMTLKSVLQ